MNTKLGEYRLLEELGEGGMGTVYKAQQTKLKRNVAIKVLPAARVQDARAVARFEREMEAIGQLNHPNIVQAYDAREVDGTHFLVMECVEGCNLTKLVECHGPLPIPDACELIRQAAVGLQYIHEHNLVHRDVKPPNLMLTVDGQIKILDLGLALLEPQRGDVARELTGTGQVMGTLDYMAPEQADDSHEVDIRADIYSLGATLYGLLCGQAPFAGHEHQKLVAKLRVLAMEQPQPLVDRRQDVPAGLSQLVDRMLAKSPDQRFSTPVEVATAIEPFCEGHDLAALISAERQTAPPAAAITAMTETDGALPSPLVSTQPFIVDKPAVLRDSRRRRYRHWAVAAGLIAPLFMLGLILYINGVRLSVPDNSEVDVHEDGSVSVRVGIGMGKSPPPLSSPQEMQLQYRIDGESPKSRFGAAAAAIGDVNQDEIPDYVVGDSLTSPQGQTNQGSVFVMSGRDGEIIRRIDGDTAHANLGSWVNAAGDVDGDGTVDILATSPNANVDGVREAGTLYVFSGRTGAVLHEFSGSTPFVQWGNQAACAGDVNGDGSTDLIAGTIRHNQDAGCATVYSSHDGAVLHHFQGPSPGNIFGHGVDGAGDLNGDGKDDVIVGAPGRPGPGVVKVFSGADGEVLFTLTGERVGDGFGHRVCGNRDLDGDGTPDFVVSTGSSSPDERGAVCAYSGRDGSLLWRFAGQVPSERFGFWALRAIPDVNSDGKDDVLAGSWLTPIAAEIGTNPPPSGNLPRTTQAAGGRASVLSGDDGSLLAYFDEQLPGSHVDAIDYLGDVNADGQPDFLVGAACVDGSDRGHVHVVTAKLSGSGSQ